MNKITFNADSDMKLYYFKYITFGTFYFIMSDTPEKSLISLKNYLKNRIERKWETRVDGSRYLSYRYEEYSKWKDAKINRLPDGYSLKVYKKGRVFEGEFS